MVKILLEQALFSHGITHNKKARINKNSYFCKNQTIDHDMLIHLYFVFKEISLILCLKGNVLWPHAFTFLSLLYFINQYIRLH